jgi:hypothetical protein
LLLRVAISIVHKMFGLVGSWNRERRLDKELRSNEKRDEARDDSVPERWIPLQLHTLSPWHGKHRMV